MKFVTMMRLVLTVTGLSWGGEPRAKRPRMDIEEAPFDEIFVSPGLSIISGIVPPSGRLLENYNFTEISRVYGGEFALALNQQAWLDEIYDKFTPVVNGSMSEMTLFGRYTLGRKISSSEQSVLYEIQGHSNLLIKYQANCVELNPDTRVSETHYVHPLIVDAVFGTKASRIGVGPKIFYLSPPGPLCKSKKGKCDFSMDEEDFEICTNTHGASLRYMIMERVRGENLWNFKKRFPKGIIPMSVSMLIATEILSLLQQLHRVGKVVHGDIHINNIMIEGLDNRNGTISLKFIDYGRSFSNMYRNNQTVRRFGWAHDSQFSSWELEGYDPAPRDDVERAVQVVAQIMMPWSYVEAEQRIGDHSSRSIWEWKRRHNWFVEPRLSGSTGPWYDPVEALEVGEEFKSGIRRNFKIILRLVRGMNDANSVPRYVDLFTGFSATRDLVIGGQTETRRAQLNNTTTTPN